MLRLAEKPQGLVTIHRVGAQLEINRIGLGFDGGTGIILETRRVSKHQPHFGVFHWFRQLGLIRCAQPAAGGLKVFIKRI